MYLVLHVGTMDIAVKKNIYIYMVYQKFRTKEFLTYNAYFHCPYDLPVNAFYCFSLLTLNLS